MSKIIINDTSTLDCFGGRLKGILQWLVSDNGTNDFPVKVIAKTNHGDGSIEETLSGNRTIVKAIGKATFTVVISQWYVTDQVLSFHVNASVKSSVFNCVIMNKTLSGRRSGNEEDLLAFSGLHDELEAMK